MCEDVDKETEQILYYEEQYMIINKKLKDRLMDFLLLFHAKTGGLESEHHIES